jgi:hypothetical protein
MSTIVKPLQSSDEVRAMLQEFQDGYSRRDFETLNSFMELFSTEKDIEVIGSGALDPGKGEWCLGMDSIRRLVENDWKYWGNLVLDVAQARIHILVDSAWLSTSGTVTYVIENEQFVRDTFKEVEEILKKREGNEQGKLLQIQREIAELLQETGQGDKYVWPLRFTAVLVRQNGLWYFHQIHFSHCTSHLPDVRLPAK